MIICAQFGEDEGILDRRGATTVGGGPGGMQRSGRSLWRTMIAESLEGRCPTGDRLCQHRRPYENRYENMTRIDQKIYDAHQHTRIDY